MGEHERLLSESDIRLRELVLSLNQRTWQEYAPVERQKALDSPNTIYPNPLRGLYLEIIETGSIPLYAFEDEKAVKYLTRIGFDQRIVGAGEGFSFDITPSDRLIEELIQLEEEIVRTCLTAEEIHTIGIIAAFWSEPVTSREWVLRSPNPTETIIAYGQTIEKQGLAGLVKGKMVPKIGREAEARSNWVSFYPDIKPGINKASLQQIMLDLTKSLTGEEFIDLGQAVDQVSYVLHQNALDPIERIRFRIVLRVLAISDPDHYFGLDCPATDPFVISVQESLRGEVGPFWKRVHSGSLAGLCTTREVSEMNDMDHIRDYYYRCHFNLLLQFGIPREQFTELAGKLRRGPRLTGKGGKGRRVKGGSESTGFESPYVNKTINRPTSDIEMMRQVNEKTYIVEGDNGQELYYLTIPDYELVDDFVSYDLQREQQNLTQVRTNVKVRSHSLVQLARLESDRLYLTIPTPPTGKLQTFENFAINGRLIPPEDYEVFYETKSGAYAVKLGDGISMQEASQGATFEAGFAVVENMWNAYKPNAGKENKLMQTLQEFGFAMPAKLATEGKNMRGTNLSIILNSMKDNSINNTIRQAKDASYRSEEYPEGGIVADYLKRRYAKDMVDSSGQRPVGASGNQEDTKLVEDLYELLFLIKQSQGRYLVTCNETARIAEIVMNYLEPDAGWSYVSCYARNKDGAGFGGRHGIIKSKDGRTVDIHPGPSQQDLEVITRLEEKYT